MGVLRNHVGDEMFNELMESLEGATIYFTPDISTRNRNIKDDYELGMSIDDLMEKYELSKSRIYDLINIIPK